MSRANQGSRVNGLAAILSDTCALLASTLEIYFPGSEPAQEKARQLMLMAAGLVDDKSGFPLATDLVPAAPIEESQA